MNPLKVTTVPEDVNSAGPWPSRPVTLMRAVVVDTLASCICEAMVRFQIRS